MTDQEDREQESQLSETTKFDELADETAQEQREIARRLATDPVVKEESEE
jgi:hypothetical protein